MGLTLGGEVKDWQQAALCLGEQLAPSGPDGYYAFTPQQWLTWALSRLRHADLHAPEGADRLRERLTCRNGYAHYCPNCDNSIGPDLIPAPQEAGDK